MFFVEALVKYLKKDRFTEILEEHDKAVSLNPLEEIPYEDDLEDNESLNCEHLFMPIDSTGEILACSKCGQLIKRSELKALNFFEHPESRNDKFQL